MGNLYQISVYRYLVNFEWSKNAFVWRQFLIWWLWIFPEEIKTNRGSHSASTLAIHSFTPGLKRWKISVLLTKESHRPSFLSFVVLWDAAQAFLLSAVSLEKGWKSQVKNCRHRHKTAEQRSIQLFLWSLWRLSCTICVGSRGGYFTCTICVGRNIISDSMYS